VGLSAGVALRRLQGWECVDWCVRCCCEIDAAVDPPFFVLDWEHLDWCVWCCFEIDAAVDPPLFVLDCQWLRFGRLGRGSNTARLQPNQSISLA
jgi:hypothetical protein